MPAESGFRSDVTPWPSRATDDPTHLEVEDAAYELEDIIIHHGGLPHAGHYVAYVRAGEGWLLIDHAIVSPVSPSAAPGLTGGKGCQALALEWHRWIELQTC